jgi:hypothetical protein
MRKDDAINGRLHSLCDRTLRHYDGRSVSIKTLAQAALSEGREICRYDFDATVTQRLRTTFRQILQKDHDDPSEQPALSNLGLPPLPRRIAVRGERGWNDDDDSTTQWVPIEKATIRQVEDNVAMRDALIASSQLKRDKIYETILAARHRGGQDDDVLLDVLSR